MSLKGNLGRKAEAISAGVFGLDGVIRDTDGFQHIAQELAKTEEGIRETELVIGLLMVCKSMLPTSVQDTLRDSAEKVYYESPFKNLPVKFPRTKNPDDWLTLVRIGEGLANQVYFLTSTQEEDYCVGFRKTPLSSKDKAYEVAQSDKQDYNAVKSIFGHIPDFIPDEYHAVFGNQYGEYNVLFIRTFVPGTLTDIFELTEQELKQELEASPTLRANLSQFVNTAYDNLDFVLDEQLDLLGKGNLVLATTAEETRLVMVEPHCRGGNKTEEKRNQIFGRLEYLKEVLVEE